MEITAADFKARCLKLMDEVAATGQPITITKRGKVVARLVPPEPAGERHTLFGYMAGSGSVVGDIVDVTDEAWEADAAAASGEVPWALSAPFVPVEPGIEGAPRMLLAAEPPPGA
jgi:prevent-host-death family protein